MVDLTSGSAYHNAAQPHTVGLYMKRKVIDFAVATTTKGSALAAADVINALDVPANTLLMAGGMKVITAMAGTATNLTLHLGTGADADALVASYDYDAAAVGDQATPIVGTPVLTTADDTVDITIATQTGTFTGGKVEVWVLCADVSLATSNPGVAEVGS